MFFFFFFSSRRRHTRFKCDWSSDVCSSDLGESDHGRSGAASFRVGDHHWLAAFHHRDAAVGGTEIDPDDFGHESALPRSVLPQGSRGMEQTGFAPRGSVQPRPRGRLQPCCPPSGFGGFEAAGGVRGLATTTAAGRTSLSFSLYPLAISETTVPGG